MKFIVYVAVIFNFAATQNIVALYKTYKYKPLSVIRSSPTKLSQQPKEIKQRNFHARAETAPFMKSDVWFAKMPSLARYFKKDKPELVRPVEIERSILERPLIKQALPPLQLAVRSLNMPRIEYLLEQPLFQQDINAFAAVVLSQIEWLEEDLAGKQETVEYLNQEIERLEQPYLLQAQANNISVARYLQKAATESELLYGVFVKRAELINKRTQLEERIENINKTISRLRNLLNEKEQQAVFVNEDYENLD